MGGLWVRSSLFKSASSYKFVFFPSHLSFRNVITSIVGLPDDIEPKEPQIPGTNPPVNNEETVQN